MSEVVNRRQFLVTAAAGAAALAVPSVLAAPPLSRPNFKLFVFRRAFPSNCTMGYLGVGGPFYPPNIIAYTLERPWRNNQQNVSSIPAGTYPAFVRYDKKDHWRLQLQNVPNRTGIQIHMGNEPSQIKGCILVGNKADPRACRVWESRVAYERLKQFFYGSRAPRRTPDMTITVIVE